MNKRQYKKMRTEAAAIFADVLTRNLQTSGDVSGIDPAAFRDAARRLLSAEDAPRKQRKANGQQDEQRDSTRN